MNHDSPLYRCDQTLTDDAEYCVACVVAGWDRQGTPTPEPVARNQRPRCLAHGCDRRIDARGDRYCAVCAGSGQGYSNDVAAAAIPVMAAGDD